jgi:uncharacterized membrane protein
MENREAFQQLDHLVLEGKLAEAIEQFFSDDAIAWSRESDKASTKAEKLLRLRHFLGEVASTAYIRLQAAALEGEVSFSEFSFAFEMKDGSRREWHEVIRRRWAEGKVREEKYYLGSFTPELPAEEAPDDLTKVEGIGPKIAELLAQAGIRSFRQLASASAEALEAILDAAGPRYRMHNPGTWPAQAQMAAEGRWEALRTWQESLSAGRA